MADEGNESRIGRMDLNLYLGLPRSPRPFSLAELGSDLALGSLPLSSSSTEESQAPANMSGAVEPSDSHAPYSPSHASYNPDLPSVDPLHPADGNPCPEYSRFYCPPHYPIPPVVQEPEGPDAPYSPPNVQVLPIVQESDEPRVEDADPHVPYDPESPSRMAERASPQSGESHIPYSPTDVPLSLTAQVPGDLDLSVYRSVPVRAGEFLAQDDGSSSRQELLQFPEFRFRRLIEVNHRLRHRRFRSSLPSDSERSNLDRPSSPIADQLVHDIMSSQREFEASGKDGMTAKSIVAEGSDEEMKEKSRYAANFECNICLDMAKEPVVTSCGHLFCWACLYQWLYLHCDHKECPVCKGEVIESNITPIYGRGSLESINEKKLEEKEESGLKVPPRPRGNRYESSRQHFRPISGRLGEGIATSWRRLVDERMHHRNIIEGYGDPSLQGIYDGGYRTPMTRMRARRMQREEGIPESAPTTAEIGLPRDSTAIPQSSNSSLLFRGGIDLWQQFSFHGLANSDRFATLTADFGRVVGRFASSSTRYAASTSSVNPPAPDPLMGRPAAPATLAADQASASSTMAVIQGDVAATDASAEPNSAGSSRSYRRRGRSNTYGSLDVDGGALHPRKRRRLN